MLAAAMLAALALPAHAFAGESLAASGSITYTWQGDPARGCAAAGLCGVQGELVVRPQGLDASSGGPIDIPLFGTSATVRVAGPGGDCIDLPGGTFGGDLFVRRIHGRLVGQIEPPLSSGRCAGPLQQDFARLTLTVIRSGDKHPSFDLRTRRSFVAGPFSGRLVSTLRLRPAPGGGGTFTSSSGSSGTSIPLGPPVRKVFVEQVSLRYRLASLPAALDATFSGEPDPFCAALAACGNSGSLALSLGSVQRTIAVTAARVVRQRVGSGRALADLRRGRLPIGNGEFPLLAPLVVPTVASETIRAPDGTQCQAASSGQAQLNIGTAPGSRPRSALEMSLSDAGDPGLLRTYCPGPDDTDVFGRSPAFLTGSVGPTQLLLRHSVISLSRSGGFAGFGYVGTRAGALRLSLTLQRVHAGTIVLRTTTSRDVP